MFDIGFTELMLIGVVALVVIGPERLPRVARTAGHLIGRLQRYVNDVKGDINRELQLDELKALQSQVAESARSLESSVRQEMDTARNAFAGIGQDAQAALDELKASAEAGSGVGAGAPSGATPAVPEASDWSQSQPVSHTPAAVSSATLHPAPTTPAASSGTLPHKFDQTTPVA